VPDGRLPVFSVGSEDEASLLLTLTCSLNVDGEFVARELVEEQTLDNLYAFGDRLRAVHDEHLAGGKRCACRKPRKPRKKK
jgi:hypothetical protein